MNDEIRINATDLARLIDDRNDYERALERAQNADKEWRAALDDAEAKYERFHRAVQEATGLDQAFLVPEGELLDRVRKITVRPTLIDVTPLNRRPGSVVIAPELPATWEPDEDQANGPAWTEIPVPPGATFTSVPMNGSAMESGDGPDTQTMTPVDEPERGPRIFRPGDACPDDVKIVERVGATPDEGAWFRNPAPEPDTGEARFSYYDGEKWIQGHTTWCELLDAHPMQEVIDQPETAPEPQP